MKFYVLIGSVILVVVLIGMVAITGNLSSAAQAQASIEQSRSTQMAIGTGILSTVGNWLQTGIIAVLAFLLLRDRIGSKKRAGTPAQIDSSVRPALPAGDSDGNSVASMLQTLLALRIADTISEQKKERNVQVIDPPDWK